MSQSSIRIRLIYFATFRSFTLKILRIITMLNPNFCRCCAHVIWMCRVS